ncbi:hypothetical protein AB0878_34960 [Amycolatopsis sp. NPDC047767]|uniref:hypothetical protein n=1 Tax=Amycolatopsis sp. NPDC047767 TaxID=3156765 RepID=UPI00345727CD
MSDAAGQTGFKTGADPTLIGGSLRSFAGVTGVLATFSPAGTDQSDPGLGGAATAVPPEEKTTATSAIAVARVNLPALAHLLPARMDDLPNRQKRKEK